MLKRRAGTRPKVRATLAARLRTGGRRPLFHLREGPIGDPERGAAEHIEQPEITGRVLTHGFGEQPQAEPGRFVAQRWSGDLFDPLINAEHRALHARVRSFNPIAVCEIALATDRLYRKVMQEAGLIAL